MSSTNCASIKLPNLSDIHMDALHLKGLIHALETLQDLGGEKSAPIWAVVQSALPLVSKLTADIERVNDGQR
jgi:hypothetical protein